MSKADDILKLAAEFEVSAKKKEKWMQKAVEEPGALHKDLGIAKDKPIPTELLEKKKKTLMERGKGDKKLSEKDRKLLQRINFALNARKAKKKKKKK